MVRIKTRNIGGSSITPTEPYGEWETHNYIEIYGLITGNHIEYEDVLCGFDLEKDKPYYLLYCVYSTGDSFGHETGRHEYICLYKTKEKAEQLARLIEIDNDKNGGRYHYQTVRGHMEDGTEFWVPTRVWSGYFENLDDVQVKEVRLI